MRRAVVFVTSKLASYSYENVVIGYPLAYEIILCVYSCNPMPLTLEVLKLCGVKRFSRHLIVNSGM